MRGEKEEVSCLSLKIRQPGGDLLHSRSHYEPVMVVGASRDQSESCASSFSFFFQKESTRPCG